ncbi:WD40/YVTN/BNR-like repeat-containing protein [Bacteroidota bacterium]
MKKFIKITVLLLIINSSFIIQNSFSQSGWIKQSIGNFHFYCVHFYNYNTGYVVSGSADFHKTTNNGLNWVYSNTGLGSPLDAYFFDTFNIVLVGSKIYHGMIRLTHDGSTWTDYYIAPNLEVFYLGATDWLDMNTGYCIGVDYNMSNYYGRIFKTTNGGNNWFEQFPSYSGAYYDIKCKSLDTSYLLTGTGLYKTINQGLNWSLYSNTFYNGKNFFFPNFDTIYVGGYWGIIKRSIDKGVTFSD